MGDRFPADAGSYSAKAVEELYALGFDPFVVPDQTRHRRMMPIPAWRRILDHLFTRDWVWRNLRTKRGWQRYGLRKETAELMSRQIN